VIVEHFRRRLLADEPRASHRGKAKNSCGGHLIDLIEWLTQLSPRRDLKNPTLAADEGVAAVIMPFSRELRWIFREVSKRDVGIDAEVEASLELLSDDFRRLSVPFGLSVG
jgi:hypothetical protein